MTPDKQFSRGSSQPDPISELKCDNCNNELAFDKRWSPVIA